MLQATQRNIKLAIVSALVMVFGMAVLVWAIGMQPAPSNLINGQARVADFGSATSSYGRDDPFPDVLRRLDSEGNLIVDEQTSTGLLAFYSTLSQRPDDLGLSRQMTRLRTELPSSAGDKAAALLINFCEYQNRLSELKPAHGTKLSADEKFALAVSEAELRRNYFSLQDAAALFPSEESLAREWLAEVQQLAEMHADSATRQRALESELIQLRANGASADELDYAREIYTGSQFALQNTD